MRLVIIVLMVSATPLYYTKILALAQERLGQILPADLTQTFNFLKLLFL
ncbi:hypothetical protein JT172_04190 [Helicobacter pylori]|nr:hypothetical protein [Helicobacter pylori]